MVMFEEVGQGLTLLAGDQGQEDVAGERQIERGVGSAMAVPVFLLSRTLREWYLKQQDLLALLPPKPPGK